MSSAEEEMCAVCGCEAGLRCSLCKTTRYCCAAHQREHWQQHRAVCTPKIDTFVQEGHFNSYYDGALFAYSQLQAVDYDSSYAKKAMERFAEARLNEIVAKGNETAKKEECGELTVAQMTENRKNALTKLHTTLRAQCLNEAQLNHIKEPLQMQTDHLRDKPLGYVCGYAHAALEIMQRMMLRDLSCKQNATVAGASAVAAWTVALQACFMRIDQP